MLAPDVFKRLNPLTAVKQEMSTRNRLLPRRWDYVSLAGNAEAVERWLRPRLRRGDVGSLTDVVFADKGWRGARPLNVMALEDRVLYRALVNLVAEALPVALRQRPAVAGFRQAPFQVEQVRYVTKTDITAYYEFVDHQVLADELIAQTGEEPAVVALMDLLARMMGRHVGLPQVHVSSDVLGDTYIDPVRRRLLRRGLDIFTYSDDFLIATATLGAARNAIEECAAEVRTLGLVLNERKTLTYRIHNYSESLGAYAAAEKRLFTDERHSSDDLSLLEDDYGDLDVSDEGVEEALALGEAPVDSDVDDAEAIVQDDEPQATPDDLAERRAGAASRAWDLWFLGDESEETQSGRDVAVTQSLLQRALPALGAAADRRPLDRLTMLLQNEPALTPQVAEYLTAYGATGKSARKSIRSALDDVVGQDIFSPWQCMWLAEAAGVLRTAGTRHHPHIDWLVQCVATAPAALAATAAAALGRLRVGDPAVLAAALDRVGPEWRQLVLWGLARLDAVAALAAAEHELDRILIAAVES